MKQLWPTCVLVCVIAACQSSTSQTPVDGAPLASPTTPPPTSTAPPPSSSSSPPPTNAASPCGEGNSDLLGVPYDIKKSRFAFGSTPVSSPFGMGGTQWVGTDGALTIMASGRASGEMNGGAPETSRPDWSADPTALEAHVREYFTSMGMIGCQVSPMVGHLGSGGSSGSTDPDAGPPTTTVGSLTIAFSRVLDAIPIAESMATAQMTDQDQSIFEIFHWPTIPGSVVAQARTFRDDLKDATKLAAYKAKLPMDAQGEGNVTIHHSSFPMSPSSPTVFKAAVAWDTITTGGATEMFDVDGKMIPFDAL